ncbi:MAG: glycosyltransferase [Acidobacteriota bacterium]|jgi:glycosyltransferase involved in cell wall biosynthesis
MPLDPGRSVTAILLSYNSEAFIAEALASLLAQDCEPMEVIVSDDASTDATYEILRQEVSRYRGPHRIDLRRRSRNTGSKSAHLNHVFPTVKGDILVSFDADDISQTFRVRRIVEAFEKGPRIKAVYSSYLLIDEAGRAIGPGNVPHPAVGVPANRWFARVDANAAGTTLAIRREVAEAFGPIDPEIAEDIVLPFRASLLGDVVFLDHSLVRARRHANSLTTNLASFESLDRYRERIQRGVTDARRNLGSRLADIQVAEQRHGLGNEEVRELHEIANRSLHEAERSADLTATSLPRRLATLFWLISRGAYPQYLRQHVALAVMPRTYLRYKRRKLHARAAARRTVAEP